MLGKMWSWVCKTHLSSLKQKNQVCNCLCHKQLYVQGLLVKPTPMGLASSLHLSKFYPLSRILLFLQPYNQRIILSQPLTIYSFLLSFQHLENIQYSQLIQILQKLPFKLYCYDKYPFIPFNPILPYYYPTRYKYYQD